MVDRPFVSRIFGVLFLILSIPFMGLGIWVMTEVCEWWGKESTTTGFQWLDWSIAPMVCFVFPAIIMCTGLSVGCSLMAYANSLEKESGAR